MNTYQVAQNNGRPQQSWGSLKQLSMPSCPENRVALKLGLSLYNEARYPQALQAFEAALTIGQLTNDKVGLGQTWEAMSLVYDHQEDYFEALNCLYQALDIWRELNDWPSVAQTLCRIALLYKTRERYPEALAQYQQALSYQRRFDQAGVVITLSHISRLMLEIEQ